MPYTSYPQIPSTPRAVTQAAESREGIRVSPWRKARRTSCDGEGEGFNVSPRIDRGAGGVPYERGPDDPLYRPLRIYTLDPGALKSDGAIATVNVPYEPLTPERVTGPDGKERNSFHLKGYLFDVQPVRTHPEQEDAIEECGVDLNDQRLLLTNGRTPSPVDPRFHQQMVYAVASLVYASFRQALGRHVSWGFLPREDDHGHPRLRLSPHGRRGHAGASYDRNSGEVQFGFVKTESEVEGHAAPDGHTFSCVSHDIVTHEVTHALLDGLRAYFLEPTSADVMGFHEGFADLIALLHHFTYKEVLRSALRQHHGKVLESALLTSIAIEFGRAVGGGGAVRSLQRSAARARDEIQRGIGRPPAQTSDEPEPDDGDPGVVTYREDMEPHEMGEVLVSAVLHAFAMVYARKVDRYMRLATDGTGVLPPGDISTDLQDLLVEEASQLASDFLNVCIRALDYCPPVDLQLGEFLRAVITADLDLVPDDPWGYREAWIDAFAKHRIYPRGVQSMSEDALKWPLFPFGEKLVVDELSFTKLAFNGDPASPVDSGELYWRACQLGTFVAEHPEEFGMLENGDRLLDHDAVTLPEVQSVRTSRRVGPDGQVVFDLVAEVTQTRYVRGKEPEKPFNFLFRGGCTVLLGPRGEVRYIIGKSVGQNSRVFRQRQFMQGNSENVAAEGDFHVPEAETVQFTQRHGESRTGTS